MAELDSEDWSPPVAGHDHESRARAKHARGLKKTKAETVEQGLGVRDFELWTVLDSPSIKQDANVDDLPPEAVFYLARVAEISIVSEVYAEYVNDEELKLWTVLEQRDFDVMDKIYEIEQNVLDRFPGVELQFRLTTQSEEGPSVSSSGVKIYEAE